MKTACFITLFAICVLNSKAQISVQPKTTDPLVSGFYNKPTFTDSLFHQHGAITKFQLIKPTVTLKTDLLLRDSSNYAYQYDKSFSKQPFLIDNFSGSKFQRVPKYGIVKRDLLLRDTDKETKLIYLSTENSK
ncbi:hypothetical protein ACS5PU_12155 [Pedobacter sp. GSP4]|uniref:hypothetical protein n=1 Tax=Pedobacter sp. GSP4 TaxID=3453716 RepID=UPI003EEF4922